MGIMDTLQICGKCCIPMDVVDPCIDVVNPCTDVVNPCMVLLVTVNKDLRAKKNPCSACGPTVILTVYGLINGF
jgi:ribosomal protein S27AE